MSDKPEENPLMQTDPSTQKKRKPRVKGESKKLVGSKLHVWEGTAQITGGKLTKDDLMWSEKLKRPISKKKHDSGKKLIERAMKAKDDPNNPLHESMKPFWDHQKKPKTTANGEAIEKKPRKKVVIKEDISEVIDLTSDDDQKEKPEIVQ